MRVSTCNLHGKSTKAGVTAVIPHFNIKQFVLSTPLDQDYSRLVYLLIKFSARTCISILLRCGVSHIVCM